MPIQGAAGAYPYIQAQNRESSRESLKIILANQNKNCQNLIFGSGCDFGPCFNSYLSVCKLKK